MTRTFNHEAFEAIANDPLIRPTLGGTGKILLRDVLSNVSNYGFGGDQCGGFIAIQIGETRWEGHTLFRHINPRAAFRRMQEGIRYMFVNTCCTEIIVRVPETNRPADHLARLGHFTEVLVQKEWEPGVSASVRSLTLDTWARACSHARAAGKEFLEHVGYEVEDVAYEGIVGAAKLMLKAGNGLKGIGFHNQWAMLAGRPVMQVLNSSPVVFRYRDKALTINEGKMEDIT